MKNSVMRKALTSVLTTTALVGAMVGFGAVAPATAALSGTPGIYIATGHDLDYHCVEGGVGSDGCDEFQILIDKATTAATPNVLALGDVAQADSCLALALDNLSGINVTYINVIDDASAYAAATLSNFDVVVTVSVYGGFYSGECDNTLNEFPTAINTRSADLIAYYNAGGGIVQQANGGQESASAWANDYYLALGFYAASVEQADPRSVTTTGLAWGITDAMANCCATHNAFINPPSIFAPLELDANGLPVTIGYENVAMPSTGIGGNDLAIEMTLDAAVGEPVAGANVVGYGSWLKVDSAWTLTLFEPAQVMCDSADLGNTNIYGAFLCNFAMPSGLAAGEHKLVLSGIAPDGSVLTRVATFVIDASGNLVSWTYSDAEPSLANTGIDATQVGLVAGGAALVMLAGAAFVTIRRRSNA